MNLLAYILALSLLILLSQAQTAPRGATGSAYARLGRYFHIQGGTVFDDNHNWVTSGQHFALDLGVSWPTSTPVWVKRGDGRPPRDAGGWGDFLAGVSSLDSNTFYTFCSISNGIAVGIYSAPNDTWSYQNYTVGLDTLGGGFWPVLDPKQNLIYIKGLVNMTTYNPQTNEWLNPESNPDGMTSRMYGRATYIPDMNSILYIGGFQSTNLWDTNVTINAQSIGQGYSNIPSLGDVPKARADFCMATSEDGSKIVVQGGRMQLNSSVPNIRPSAFSNEMFVYDVKSSTWTKGAPMTSPRIQSACVIVGDQFISWSGSLGDMFNNPVAQNIVGSEITIFNITSLQWVDKYVPSTYMPNSSTTGGTSTPSQTNGPTLTPKLEPSSGSNMAPIIGGVVGGAVVVFGIVGFVIYQRKKKSPNTEQDDENNFTSVKLDDLNGRRAPHGEYISNLQNPQAMTYMSYEKHNGLNG